MSKDNQTYFSEFLIVGFPGLLPKYYPLVSSFFFLVYLATFVGNSLILGLVVSEKSLHKPMYFIICNLAVSDLLFSTLTLPKIIARYWFNAGAIPFTACFMQMYLVHYLGSVNSFILMVMAIDRYVAIRNPLRYQSIMSSTTVFNLCAFSWLITLIFPAVITIRAFPLSYCRSNAIIHCYCDHIGITQLACTDITSYSLLAFIFAMLVLLLPLSFIIFSYIQIVISVLKIASPQGRYKTFSTCSVQLIIIALYYVPRSFVYMANRFQITINTDFRILMIVMYSLLPPMINPLIYFLRTKEIKTSLLKKLRVKRVTNFHENTSCPVCN
ncbi:olfactory receptor 2AT4-like [Acipenser ruthenus]|uniref:olfactory receptor 2AT4-like n=1 Tax=Acipenser ruthenus TaxID=7906 RepID=UPI0027416D2F|nr:olfactory receptor 2AT4-like [Acipenser ruthenus]